MTGGKSEGVLDLGGSGYVVTESPMVDFPTSEITVTMWVRASHLAPHGKRAFLSYVTATENRTNAYQEFAIYDGSALSVVIAGRSGLGAANSVEDVKSKVRIDDGYWHFIAVTWRKAGGELEIYKDGKREFVVGAYRSDMRSVFCTILISSSSTLLTTRHNHNICHLYTAARTTIACNKEDILYLDKCKLGPVKVHGRTALSKEGEGLSEVFKMFEYGITSEAV